MPALREKVTISLDYDELITIEKMKKRLVVTGLLEISRGLPFPTDDVSGFE